MRVLVVYNSEASRLGQIEVALKEVGAAIEPMRPYLGEELPVGAEGFDAAVILGGVQNALADDAFPWQPPQMGLMRVFTAANRSVLGLCLGGQLLAREYGAKNIIGEAVEFGWSEVELSAKGRTDPLFAGLPSSFPTFHLHEDTFTLPKDATHLASTHKVRNQAFRTGRATYGVQFHFEAHQAQVLEWNRMFADVFAKSQPDWGERHPLEAKRYGAQSDATGLTMARNWVSTIV